MREDLRNHALTGVLPILLAYAAAQGDPLQSVECLDLTDQGTLEPTQGHPRAVRITFAAQGDPRPRTLTYFSLDLSNPGLQSRTGQAFLAFLGSRGRSITYLKSASYLLHGQGFSTVRAFILQHSLAVLQDDSGIPHHFFGAGAWTFLPYGRYEGPIPMFKAFEQKDLRAGFHAGSPRPLGFGIGYKFRGTASNLELYQAH
jgi:hypothetical protein